MADRDYEAEASEQGWVNKDNWKGDPEQHTDAKTFVERGNNIAGILKKRLDKQATQITSLQESNKQFGEYHKTTLETQRKKDAERISDLEGKLSQAVTDGDGQTYTQTRKELQDLQTALPPADENTAWDALAQKWAGDNEWYQTNPKLAIYADGLADRVRAEGYNGQAYFSELTRRVKEDHPEEFTNPKKTAPSGVEDAGQLSNGDSKAHTFENLPAEAKTACNSFVADGFMTQADYVSKYEWEGA